MRATTFVTGFIISLWDKIYETKFTKIYDRRTCLWYCESRGPLWSQNVQTDSTVGVDIRVVDTGGERKFGGFEGVVGGEVDVEKKDSTLGENERF